MLNEPSEKLSAPDPGMVALKVRSGVLALEFERNEGNGGGEVDDVGENTESLALLSSELKKRFKPKVPISTP